MNSRNISLLALALIVSALGARAEFGPGEARFRSLYQELVETNTTLSGGQLHAGG